MEHSQRTKSISTIKHQLIKQQIRSLLSRFLSNKLLVIGSITLVLMVLFAIFGPIFSKFDPYSMNSPRLIPPNGDNWAGTDNFGRDMFSRLSHGARVTLTVGLLTTFFSSVLGLIIGLYASYYPVLDQIFMRITDGLMAIPSILLAISLMAAFGPLIENIIIALSIVYTPYIARIIRSEALSIRKETYIEAMRAQGAKNWRIIWGHIMPNTISPLIVQATFNFAEAILVEASLSFLGAGVPTPEPSWGNILFDGKVVIYNGWWMIVLPGIFIALSILSLNLLGDGLRDFIDPKVK